MGIIHSQECVYVPVEHINVTKRKSSVQSEADNGFDFESTESGLKLGDRSLASWGGSRVNSFHNNILNAKAEYEFNKNLPRSLINLLVPRNNTVFCKHSALRLFRKVTEDILYTSAQANALEMFYWAQENCPAYKNFIQSHPDKIITWADIPPISKDNYIKVYPTNELFQNGIIPTGAGSQLDTSTGTSGIPTMWYRSKEELEFIENMLVMVLDIVLGFDPDITLVNMFALGMYATGMTVSRCMKDRCNIFSTGPNFDAVIRFISFSESDRQKSGLEPGKYIIAGYPPHLLELCDKAKKSGIDFSKQTIYMVCGGETMSIHTREMIESFGVKMIISTYGASDLDINIGGQNVFDIELNRAIKYDEELLVDICGPSVRNKGTPIVFHVNLWHYYVENNQKGELLFTCQNKKKKSPRIKYNLGDIGMVVRASKIRSVLAARGYTELLKLHNNSPFPNLILWGRYGIQLTFNGANVYPINLDAALNRPAASHLREITRYAAYQADPDTNHLTAIWLEVKEDVLSETLDAISLRDQFLDGMCEDNGDFNWQIQTCRSNGSPLPELKIFPHGQSPMKHDPHRKREYIFYQK